MKISTWSFYAPPLHPLFPQTGSFPMSPSLPQSVLCSAASWNEALSVCLSLCVCLIAFLPLHLSGVVLHCAFEPQRCNHHDEWHVCLLVELTGWPLSCHFIFVLCELWYLCLMPTVRKDYTPCVTLVFDVRCWRSWPMSDHSLAR